MPLPAIPLEDTLLFSEFTLLNDGYVDDNGPGNPYADSSLYSAMHSSDIIPIERPTEVIDSVKGITFTPENYKVTADELKQYILQGISRIVPWQPNTSFSKEVRDSANNVVRGNDIVVHDGSLYLTVEDFISGATFLEKNFAGDTALNLARIKLDTDKEYVEITASANAPLLSSDIIGRYVSMRRLYVNKLYTLPNLNVAASSPNIEHKAVCNGNITTDCIIKIMCERGGASPAHIGTITFTAPIGTFLTTDGVFTFNDAEMGPDAANTLNVNKGYILYFEMDTVPVELEWVVINMLAFTATNYTHPSFTIAE